jgi:hypothetical protein
VASATGLRCRARLDHTDYQTGLKITAAQMAENDLSPQRVFSRWNYTISPRKPAASGRGEDGRAGEEIN